MPKLEKKERADKMPVLPSFQMKLRPEDFEPAGIAEKESLAAMRPSVSFWKDGLRRFSKNKIAMVSFVVIVLIMAFAFIGPYVYPYQYDEQLRGDEVIVLPAGCEYVLVSNSGTEKKPVAIMEGAQLLPGSTSVLTYPDGREVRFVGVNDYIRFADGGKLTLTGGSNLGPWQYSTKEQLERLEGGYVFPHILGSDSLARDLMVRLMVGSRISLIVGIVASFIILVIGSTYGAVAGFFGGAVDMVMMRFVDIVYTVPDILIIILLSVTLKFPLASLAGLPGFGWIDVIGVPLICIFIVFSLLYWVGMARIVRGQILALKEQEYVTAARALGAGSGRIIRRHLLTNCIGTLIVTTMLQIPSSIFTESFLSFMGLGVTAPLPSLGSMAAAAINGITSYPLRLFAPVIMISLIILTFNLLGDGLRDAFDPKLKQ